MDTQSWLARLAASPHAEYELDEYGQGALAQALESRVASLLGKPTATFMPKGTIAQQVALRVHAESNGNRRIAIHPQSHMAIDECDAMSELANLDVQQVGHLNQPMSLRDLSRVGDTIGTVVIEIPLRRAGFLLPKWDELVAMCQWARERGITVHFDGARIWECAPYYRRSLAEIAALADSVYVSLYKGLGAMAGCLLVGNHELLEESKLWQQRYGGYLYAAAPYLVGGLDGLDRYLGEMNAYVAEANELCAQMVSIPRVSVTPDPPQTNGFQVHFQLPADLVWNRCLSLARAEKVWLFDDIAALADGNSMGEIQVGSATLQEPAAFWCAKIKQLAAE